MLDGPNYLMESRAKAAAELYHAGRCNLFITTGSVKWDSIYGRLTEAQILALHMMDFGVPKDGIILENQATITRANFQPRKVILDRSFHARRRIVTVSSYGHLVRSVSLARAYILEHEHVAYRAVANVDCPERFKKAQKCANVLRKNALPFGLM